MERYVLAQADNPLAGHPERLPLELIGDGVTPRYQDSERGEITRQAGRTCYPSPSRLGSRLSWGRTPRTIHGRALPGL